MFWAPSSPDLNPLDYSIWSAMKKFLLRDLVVKNEQELRHGIDVFFDTHQELIKNSIIGSVKGLVTCFEHFSPTYISPTYISPTYISPTYFHQHTFHQHTSIDLLILVV